MKKQLIYIVFIIAAFALGTVSADYLPIGNSPENNPTTSGPGSPEKDQSPSQNSGSGSFWDFNSTPEANLQTFWKVWEILDHDFYDLEKINNEQRVYGAIKGMVNSLGDPYTLFMTPKETDEFEASLEGVLQGIGAELTVENGNLIVVSPIRGTPAERAGLKPGDIVYKIDDKVTGEMTLIDAIMSIRGAEGTEVTLLIIREGTPDPFEVKIKRESINIPSLELEFSENIAIMSINQFNDKTLSEFTDAMGKVLVKKPIGLIVDLRYNGGGYLDTSVDLLSAFFEKKEKAVIIKQRDSSKNEVIYTSGSGKLKDMPVVVLINEGSASASEIFAGAIQDHKRGLLIGEKSHGKGSVQQIEDLNDGSSLRITIAKWFTPLDRSIDKVGILPDRVIELTEEDSKNQVDPQLDEAKNYLKGLY